MKVSSLRHIIPLFSISALFILLAITTDAYGQNDSNSLPYPFKDESAYPYKLPANDTGITLRNPSNIKSDVKYDPVSNSYIITDKVGDMDYRPAREVSINEYNDLKFKQSLHQFWKTQAKGESTGSSSFFRNINIKSKAFNKIFGSNVVDIKPQGSAELIFSINTSRIDNPALQERLRSTTTFDFQENIQMNVTGTIGDKVKLGITYDTEATFDFENKTNLGYSGEEDEIVQKIEAGNVSLPLSGSLITGSQNLFGLKTELKFGKMTVTTVLSQQKGKTKTIEIEGGAERKEFEVEIDDYDANKHFFLSHFFSDIYDNALRNIPLIASGVQITNIEVWITNKNASFESSRNIVGFMDLAETRGRNISNPGIDTFGIRPPNPENTGNSLYDIVQSKIRDVVNITDILENPSNINGIDLEKGTDYEKIESARLLSPNEYSLNEALGFISLNSALNTDEILAVSFTYTYKGKTYKVGELSSEITAPKTLILKLIKGTSLTPKVKTWDLMMKNIYSLNAYQVDKEDFELDILYQDDETGTEINYLTEGPFSNRILLGEMNLDNVNSSLDVGPDGIFDFITGITILPTNGRIIFPVKQPFGTHLKNKFKGDPDADELIDKYVFNELYDSTKIKAQQIANKNKFVIRGSYKSAGGSDISLNAMNVPKGSVKVTAGGILLIEGTDFIVDYTLGRVKILNAGLLESGTPIQISLESNSLYNLQTKTLLGTHLDYKFSENFNLGGTILNLTERPLTKKINFGDEPISNTIWGINGSYSTKSQFLTTLVDKIPLIETKEVSRITIDGEFAHLIPGHSKAIEKKGIAYIDDFEGCETSMDIKSFSTWVIASTPKRLTESSFNNNLRYNYNRAKFSWYVIDRLFLNNTNTTPDNIKDNPDIVSSHLVREVYEKEIWENKEEYTGVPTNISVLNLAFYPNQRGPYNYSPDVAADGNLSNDAAKMQNRWGGIMREIPTSDFEAANIEFIDFWMMDPFIEKQSTNAGGQLIFNLGEVSEDILKDSRKMFENGLPAFDNTTSIDSTVWGRIPTGQSMVNAFDNNVDSRKYQDVGLDGLDDDNEQKYFYNFLDTLRTINPKAYTSVLNDPSSDNFMYYRSTKYDDENADVLRRYKDYNGLDGNSPASEQTSESYSTSGSTLPDVEDINSDNTLNETESYYEYRIDLRKNKMVVGENYITDKVNNVAKFVNGEKSEISWYHFRIPVRTPAAKIGNISDFNSIRFARMYLTGFSDSIFLRFASIDLIRGEWRKYYLPLAQPGEALTIPESSATQFDITAVNIEENASKDPVNYVLPPGVDRVVDPSSPQLRQLNEQAIALKITNLEDGDAKAAYKNMNIDMREYKRLEMFIHAEEIPGCLPLADYELTAFIRIGSDYTNNYYEYEVPLKLTTPGNYSNEDEEQRRQVWPDENFMDIDLDIFPELKIERNKLIGDASGSISYNTVYSTFIGKNKLSVKGNPSLSDVTTVMIGIRNPRDQNGSGNAKCGEIWINELRMSNFREKGGWAANARITTQLADFANVSLAGSTSKPGFGSIEKKTNERSKEEINQYDLSSNVHLDKFFPEKAGVRIPMYIGYSKMLVNPQYSPLDQDILFKEELKSIEDKTVRDSVRKISREEQTRKSLNFTNVGLSKTGKGAPQVYDPSNISLDYSYSELNRSDIKTEYDLEKEYRGGLTYNYQTRPKSVEPFKNVFKKPYLQILRDFNFNYVPSMIGFRTSMDRRYNERKLRSLNDPRLIIPSTVDKDFLWQREYQLKFDLTRTLRVDFSAMANAKIDELPGKMTKDSTLLNTYYDSNSYEVQKAEIMKNIRSFGRPIQYSHKLDVNYTIPINKIPILNWTSLNVGYNSTYSWDAAPLLGNNEAGNKIDIGNTIANTNNIQINGNLSMRNLYNKVKYLKKVNQKFSGKKKPTGKGKKETHEIKEVNMIAKKAKKLKHPINNKEVKVWVTTASGTEVEGKLSVLSKRKIAFTPKKDITGAKVKIEGEAIPKANIIQSIVDQTARFIMSVQTISGSYSKDQSTVLPGFTQDARVLGMSGASSGSSPGIPFVFGYQDQTTDFLQQFEDRQWLTRSEYLDRPVDFSYGERMNMRATVEPIDGLRIELTTMWSQGQSKSIDWYPIYNDTSANYIPPSQRSVNLSGNYTISIISLRTAFEKVSTDDGYSSPSFERFKKFRLLIAERLAAQDANYTNKLEASEGITPADYPIGYGPGSQQVLIPAFLAAYTNRDPNKSSLNPMPNFLSMLPNWQARYSKLTQIPLLKKYFKTINLNHAYSSIYSVGNYISNQDFNDIDNDIERNLEGDIIALYDIDNISISEQFRPLIGVDMTLSNNITARFEIKKSRNLSLSMASNMINEVSNDDIIIGSGYRFDKLELKIGEKVQQGDLTLNADLSKRNNKTILRDLSETNPDQPSSGKKIWSIKVSADYQLSSSFSVRVFYDRIVNKPLISRTFPTKNTNIGFSLRFTLAQ